MKRHNMNQDNNRIRSTTVLALRKDGLVVMAADGQVTMGNTIVKAGAKKVRRLYQDKVLAGFAGSTADAFTLFERLEGKLEAYAGNLTRAAVELAKDWRTDKSLRRLEALLIAADKKPSFDDFRPGRCDRARRGSGRHRIGRALRSFRGPGAHGPQRSGARGCGERGHEHSCGYLHIHQSCDYRGRALDLR